jgi:hypothetical protein
MTGPVSTARTAWGEALPFWVERLAVECAATSQNKVAKQLGVSAAMISHVLRRSYAGDLAKLEQRVEGVFMSRLVDCPALGAIPSDRCVTWQTAAARQFQNPSPLRARMYRACHRCARFTKGRTDAE